jgi:hypothetical protein
MTSNPEAAMNPFEGLEPSRHFHAITQPKDLTRKDHDAADALLRAALTEIGIYVNTEWSEPHGCYIITIDDLAALDKARASVFDTFGWQYEWITDPTP